MKRKVLILVLLAGVFVGTASAQFGGIVFDPTNYANALLRYYQLEQHLIQLKNSYAQLVMQYNLALQMAKNIENMPARYGAQFSEWRNTFAPDAYGNTGTWVEGINSGLFHR
jgi:conjugal transfer/entry exclusion protein